MSKKSPRRRAASGKPAARKTAASAKPAAKAPGQPASPLTYAVAVVGGAIIYLLLYCWTAKVALFLAPVAAGAFVAFVLTSAAGSAFAGAVAGLVGATIGATVMASATFASLLQQAPIYMHGDVQQTVVYTIAMRLVADNPANSLSAGSIVVAGTFGTAACAWAVAAGLAAVKEDRERVKSIVAAALVFLVCSSFVYTALFTSSEFIHGDQSKPLQPGGYAYDAMIYMQTYYNMLAGQGYYDAIMNAASGDQRIAAAQTVRAGKYYPGGWIWGPAAIRRPTIFYAWKFLAPEGAGGVTGLGIWLSAIVLGLSYWALLPYLGKRAIIGPVALMPYFLWMSLGYNPFFPDYWAALFGLAALLLILRKQWIAGAVVLFIAAITRETTGPVLGVFALATGYVWLRDRKAREWLIRAVVFAALAVAWLVLERVHEAAGAPYFAFAYQSSAQLLLSLAGTRTLVDKLIQPTEYLTYAYGFFKVLGVTWLILAPLGFWAALTRERQVRLTMLAFVGFWALFLVVFGASSSYWGQTLMPPFLLGSALIIACADRLDRSLQVRTAIE